MYYKRNLEVVLQRFSKFPAIALLGPRQSGKTTIVKNTFKNHVFLSLEDPEIRDIALNDPKVFLRTYENEHGIILDEFQYAPNILSYIQLEIDEKKRPGYFILTGSQNFLVNEAITQSLAGRVGILTLLPMSLSELNQHALIPNTVDELILQGCYPRIYAESFLPQELYPSYIHSYLERDVRTLVQVTSLQAFQKFLTLCAARIGNLLNLSELASNCGISVPTAQHWLSVLEASYIIYQLRPYWNNFNKRITKTPKFYFYDTGVACSLLGIRNTKDLLLNPLYGSLFECLIMSDLHKQYFNQGLPPPLYFWRDQNGRIEVDCIIDRGSQMVPVEIKSTETFSQNFFDGIAKWNEISGVSLAKSYAIYGGSLTMQRENGRIVSWRETGNLIEQFNK